MSPVIAWAADAGQASPAGTRFGPNQLPEGGTMAKAKDKKKEAKKPKKGKKK